MQRPFYALFLLPLLGIAQEPSAPKPGPEAEAFKFTTSTQLVIEAVAVTDRSGKPIKGLTGKDFTLTEDGIPQTISVCEFQELQDAPRAAAEAWATGDGRSAAPEFQGGPAAQRPGQVQYKDRRLLVLYFDMSAIPPADQARARTAAIRFITTRMAGPDLVAILSFSDAVRVRQNFTDDRQLLLNAVNKLFIGDLQTALQRSGSNDTAADSGTAFGEDDSEFNLFTIDRQLSGLQTAVKMLGAMSEKKALVYFASGLQLNGTGNHALLAATTNAAIKANISIYTVDTRGMAALPPLGDASQGSQGGLAMYTGASAMSMASELQQSQDTLYALAADTGGKALVDNNDLVLGIENAQKAIRSYYILGYYPTNAELNGRFRRIKITYNGEVAAKLAYRQGYYAGKTFHQFTAADKERQLQEALMLGDPITELTIASEVHYFQMNSAEYFVPVTVKIPGSELVLARRSGSARTVVDFIGEVKDENRITVANVRDKVEIKLNDETAAQLARRPIQYDTGFTLLPGTYSLKLLARDNETGRIGTYLTSFVVPNLNREQKRLAISSVVLSSQRVAIKDALYTADRSKAPSVNPLIERAWKLIPSVTRVFSKTRDLYVYLEAYRTGASSDRPLFGFLTFYRDQSKAFETAPLAVTESIANGLRTVPVRFSASLEKLRAGKYICQVTVVDATNQKVAFWQAPILIVP